MHSSFTMALHRVTNCFVKYACIANAINNTDITDSHCKTYLIHNINTDFCYIDWICMTIIGLVCKCGFSVKFAPVSDKCVSRKCYSQARNQLEHFTNILNFHLLYPYQQQHSQLTYHRHIGDDIRTQKHQLSATLTHNSQYLSLRAVALATYNSSESVAR